MPTAPGPLVRLPQLRRQPLLTFLWAMMVDPTGMCIVGATVEWSAGRAFADHAHRLHHATPGHMTVAYLSEDLTPGVEMTLRASASGYASQEKTVVPSSGGQMALLFTSSRIQ